MMIMEVKYHWQQREVSNDRFNGKREQKKF
jgi:hypothetical protein